LLLIIVIIIPLIMSRRVWPAYDAADGLVGGGCGEVGAREDGFGAASGQTHRERRAPGGMRVINTVIRLKGIGKERRDVMIAFLPSAKERNPKTNPASTPAKTSSLVGVASICQVLSCVSFTISFLPIVFLVGASWKNKKTSLMKKLHKGVEWGVLMIFLLYIKAQQLRFLFTLRYGGVPCVLLPPVRSSSERREINKLKAQRHTRALEMRR
jgi:hypothetical protein